jgi:hypothetical protein
MSIDDDKPLSDEEMVLARKGEALIKAEVARTAAPQSLRERIEADRERARKEASRPFWRRHPILAFAGGGVAAVLISVAVAGQLGGSGGEPSLGGVDAVASLSPTEAAPASLGGSPPVLAASVGEIEFPDWREKFGWKAVGQRQDEVSDRTVTTVAYRNPEGVGLGYAIVDGGTLDQRPAGETVLREGKSYHVAADGSRTVVTWNQQGHTCVIVASSKVRRSTLIDLAASRNV